VWKLGKCPLSDAEVEIIAREGEIFAAIVEIGQMEEIWATG
jgi:hypothetical protein